jgi:hypothetical protein
LHSYFPNCKKNACKNPTMEICYNWAHPWS